MKISKSITVIIPAYNEEANLAKAVKNYGEAVGSIFDDYELIIFNDCSRDRTGEIADELARKNTRVRVVHNKRNMGLGYNFREGAKLSTKDYCILFPGEGEVLGSSIKEVLSHIGEADLIVTYVGNPEERQLYRNIVSWSFTTLLNVLFGYNLKYYNGLVLYETKILKNIKMTTNSFAYQAEVLIRLFKKGYSHKEVPFYVEKTKGTTAFRIKNMIGVFFTVLRLFFEINILRRI